MQIRGIKERDGAWYVIDHELHVDGAITSLPRTEWADFDDNGDLLFTEDGRLYRLAANQTDRRSAVELIDLRDQTFEQMAPTAEAQRWGD